MQNFPADKFVGSRSRVMAFLRSVTRYNALVSRNLSSSPSAAVSVTNDFNLNSHGTAELLSSSNHRFSVELRRRHLHTKRNVPVSTAQQQRQYSNNNIPPNNVSSTSQMSTIAATAKLHPQATTAASNDQNSSPQRDPLDTGFDDPIAAFKSKTTWELVRAYIVYIMCSSEYLVENNMKVTENVTIIFRLEIFPAAIYLFINFF